MSLPELVAGRIIARKYTIRALRGRTPWAATYGALTAPNRDVALKVTSLDGEGWTRRSAELAQIHQAVRLLPGHFVLAPIDEGVDEEARLAYVVSVLSATPSLAELVEICPLTPIEAASFLRSLGQALDAAHDKGLAHLGLRPSNVFVGPPPRCLVQIADFGGYLLRGADDAAMKHAAAWLAPEQWEGDGGGRSADVFAAALVTFFALARGSFWRSASAAPDGDYLRAVKNEQNATRAAASDRAKELDASLPPALDAVFARALAREPRARFARVSELARAFADAIEAPPMSTTVLFATPSDGAPAIAKPAPPSAPVVVPPPAPPAPAPAPATDAAIPPPPAFVADVLTAFESSSIPPPAVSSAPVTASPIAQAPAVDAADAVAALPLAPPAPMVAPMSPLADASSPNAFERGDEQPPVRGPQLLQRIPLVPVAAAAGLVALVALGGGALVLARHSSSPASTASSSVVVVASAAPHPAPAPTPEPTPAPAPARAAAPDPAPAPAPAPDPAPPESSPAATALPTNPFITSQIVSSLKWNEAEIEVICHPDCTRVVLNGGVAATGPSNVLKVRPGIYGVRGERDSYGGHGKKVTVRSQQRLTLTFDLSVVPTTPPPPPPKKPCGKFLKRCD